MAGIVSGKVAIVTGAARGVGRGIALLMAKEGAKVVVCDIGASLDGAGRDDGPAQEVVNEIRKDGGDAIASTLSISEPGNADKIIQATLDAFGRVDILVNNAGASIRKPSTELSKAEWNTVIAVNQSAVFLCSRAAARHMLPKQRGAIVNLASIMGFSGGGLYPNISYQTSKGAVVNMTRALAVEWAPHQIRVNAVAPTYVKTPFIAGLMAQPELVQRIEAMTPLRRLADPIEIASAVLYLASPAAAMVTGHTLLVDGGFMAQ